jgi:DNA-binding response OmpR family regulator
MVIDYLEDHSMRGLSASGHQELVRHFAAGEPDLIVLDLRLDQEDGLDLLREIRSRSDVPVIIITGDRRDEIDRVVGLELGADPRVADRSAIQSCVDSNSAAGSSIGVSAVLSIPADPKSP